MNEFAITIYNVSFPQGWRKTNQGAPFQPAAGPLAEETAITCSTKHIRFMFSYLLENTYTLPTILHWSNLLALTLWKWVISVWNHQDYENFWAQGTFQPMYYEQKNVSKKKTWGNLSTRKKLVTLICSCISFSVPVVSDCGLASGQTYIPGVGVSCLCACLSS